MSLLRLVMVGSVFTLVVNDHFLKKMYPSFLTGKLSDVAGMIFFPMLIASLLGLLRNKSHRQRTVSVAGCALATGLVFAAVKTFDWANDVYSRIFGLSYSLIASVETLVRDLRFAPLQKTTLVMDPTDLWAVVFVLVPVCLVHFESRRSQVLLQPQNEQKATAVLGA